MSDHRESSSGSFLTGLVFGVVAGAVGYYIFKTEEGKQTKRRLIEEWEKAKDQLVSQGVIPDNMELPQVIQHTIQRMTEPVVKKTNPDLESSLRKKADKKKSEAKKFKGAK